MYDFNKKTFKPFTQTSKSFQLITIVNVGFNQTQTEALVYNTHNMPSINLIDFYVEQIGKHWNL